MSATRGIMTPMLQDRRFCVIFAFWHGVCILHCNTIRGFCMKYIIAVIKPHKLDPVREALTALGVRAAGCCQSDKGVAKRRMHCCGLTSHVAIDMERKAGLDWPRDRFSREEVLGRKATRHSVRHPVEVQEACRTSRQRNLAYNQIGSMPACLRSR